MRLSHRDTSVMYLWTLLFISSFSCTAASNSIEISCELAKQKESMLALVTSNTSFGIEETRGKLLLCYFHVFLWLTLVRVCVRVCVVCTGVRVNKLMCTGGEQRRMPGSLRHHSPHILPSRPFIESEVPHFSEAGQQAPEIWCLWPPTLGWQAAMPGFYVSTGDLNSEPLTFISQPAFLVTKFSPPPWPGFFSKLFHKTAMTVLIMYLILYHGQL